MANLFYTVFNGNLTANATFTKVADDKGIINFTVAHNFPTSKKDENNRTIYEPQFYSCTKWVNSGEEPTRILDSLKKGNKVTVEVNKIDISKHVKEDMSYTNINFIVSNIIS